MRRYAPDPTERANSAPPDILAGFLGEDRNGNREGKGKGGKRKVRGKKRKGKGSESEKGGGKEKGIK